MEILIPILSKKENDPEFLAKASLNAQEIFLITIVDANAPNQSFGFTATEISHANALVQEIKELLAGSNKRVIDVLEWGDTVPKIANYAKLKKIKKIVLKQQDTPEFKKLVKQLRTQHHNVEVV